MKLVRFAAVFVILALATTGLSITQDNDKVKGSLPKGWAKLNLSEDQKNKVYDIQNRHHAKIDELKKQISDEEEKMNKERLAVLTPEQKKKLKDAVENKLGEGEKKKETN
jgi:Spy/CpxP family protein refolding chaperone